MVFRFKWVCCKKSLVIDVGLKIVKADQAKNKVVLYGTSVGFENERLCLQADALCMLKRKEKISIVVLCFFNLNDVFKENGSSWDKKKPASKRDEPVKFFLDREVLIGINDFTRAADGDINSWVSFIPNISASANPYFKGFFSIYGAASASTDMCVSMVRD